MNDHNTKFKYINPLKEAKRLAISYLIMSIIWIIFSDGFILRLFKDDIVLYNKIQSYKGILFVCVSSILIFLMVYYRIKVLLKLINELSNHKEVSQAKIDYLDFHDSLTGLPRRLLMEKQFLNLIEGTHKNKNITLVNLDIDNFTQINEAIGNVAGDYYILHLSQVLGKIIKGNNLLAKISQENFGILLTDVNSKSDIDSQVKIILKTLEEPWVYEGRELFISVTAGISTYPNDCQDFYSLLRYSNIALKYAKVANKGWFEHYSINIEREVVDSLEIVDNIKRALINQEFYLNYQLVLSLHDEKIAGVETLIRWNHPLKGNIPPIDFIPIAEQSSLIVEITEYVINTALEQKRVWRKEGYNIPKIAINIPARSMNTVGFCHYIEEKITMYEVSADELILELTESTFVENLIEIDVNIKYLRKIGVEIALDDFGTGYSTMARLKDLNIDYLKLDRAFIMELQRDSSDEILVKSVIEVAKVLGISVCAEGIETLEVLNLLTEMGCTLGQGFFIHRPSDTLPLNF